MSSLDHNELNETTGDAYNGHNYNMSDLERDLLALVFPNELR